MTRPGRRRGAGQVLTRADRALIALLVAGIAGLLFHQGRARTGAEVIVEVDGQPPQMYPLSSPQILRLWGPLGESRVEIAARGARFVASPCPEQRCVYQGWIHRRGEAAACIPNRIALRIAGGLDALSR